MVAILQREGASDEDLIFSEFASLFQHAPGEWLADVKERLRDHAEKYRAQYICCNARIRSILLPRDYTSCCYQEDRSPVPLSRETSLGGTPFLDRGWPRLEIVLSAYCQRILYSWGPGFEDVEKLIREGTDPEKLQDAQKYIETAQFIRSGKDRQRALDILHDILVNMSPIPEDEVGFASFCTRARIAWLRVDYIRDLASRDFRGGKGGPFPRRQELDSCRIVVGVPPIDQRTFVVSHGWESEVHPSPSGGKFRKLALALGALQAADEDLVFFDFCSLPQADKLGNLFENADGSKRNATAPAYFDHNSVPYISDRTQEEWNAFGVALFDMSRLYAYKRCEVIVLPALDLLDSFPDGNVWGFVNERPYHNRGWCCAEFSVAHANSRIVNLDDPEVKAVLKTREWPKTVAGYAKMMDESASPRVDFTYNGDRAAVKYNFFKMAMSVQPSEDGKLVWRANSSRPERSTGV